MATRDTFTSGTVGAVTGDDFMDNVAGHIATLYNASALPLTGVAGTANAVTATLDPPLSAALVLGMKFTITWAAANTGMVTLSLNGGTAVPVLTASAGGLPSGALAAGRRDLLEFTGGAFRVLSATDGAAGAQNYYYAFTTSGTLTLPVGLEDDRMVTIEAWGGGGGGGANAYGGGGGGGGYAVRRMRYADLPSSVTVTIGAGGAINTSGGNTTFGALLTAYGGGRGGDTGGVTGAGGGGGGGSGEAGQSTNPSATPGLGGRVGGGDGEELAAADAKTIYGGGGGSRGDSGVVAANLGGGNAVFGGGGGGSLGQSAVATAAGTSLHGGNGGVSGSAGSAPAGGGGRNAAGARGEVRVWI